jgi:hypothetical protein
MRTALQPLDLRTILRQVVSDVRSLAVLYSTLKRRDLFKAFEQAAYTPVLRPLSMFIRRLFILVCSGLLWKSSLRISAFRRLGGKCGVKQYTRRAAEETQS